MIVMKGITNIEFVLALFVFLTTITFISATIITKVPLLQQESLRSLTKLKAYTISNIVLFDRNEQRMGLSTNEWYVLDASQLSQLDCNDFKKFGGVIVNITTINGNNLFYCKTGEPLYEFHVKRIATDTQGRILKIDVVGV